MNFIIAGRDTTADLLSWFMYEMTKMDENGQKVNQSAEKKIRDEIDTVLDASEKDGYVYCFVVNFCVMFALPTLVNICSFFCSAQGYGVRLRYLVTFSFDMRVVSKYGLCVLF